MTPASLHLFLFSATVVVFAAIGFRAGRRQNSASDYFRNTSLWKNAVSLTASNITLGTGLVYLISAAQSQGTLMLVVPWALFAGYLLLGLLVEKAAESGLGNGKNLLADVSSRISAATGTRSEFARVVSVVLAVLLVALLGFEIFASAKVIAPVLFPGATVRTEIILSTTLFAITLLYTILGGIRAVLSVDFLQVPLILLFLPAFVAVGIFGGGGETSVTAQLASKADFATPVLLAIGGAVINAFSGQFFSLLNIGAVSQVEARQRRKLTTRVGFLTAAALSLFVLVGLFVNPVEGATPWASLMSRFEATPQGGGWGLVLSSVVVLGMTSIVLTTTGAVVFSAIFFWYDNVAGRDSRSSSDDKAELRRIRLIGTVVFIASFAFLAMLNYFQPDPFYLVLALAGGVSVLAPAIVVAVVLACDKRTAASFTPRIFGVFLFILGASCLGNAFLVSQRSTWVASWTNVMFTISAAFAFGVWIYATHTARRVTS